MYKINSMLIFATVRFFCQFVNHLLAQQKHKMLYRVGFWVTIASGWFWSINIILGYMFLCKLSFFISITYICSISSWVSSGTRRPGVSRLARLSWGPCITWWSLDKKVRCIQQGRAYTQRSEENKKVKSKQKSNKYTKGQKVNKKVRSTRKDKK